MFNRIRSTSAKFSAIQYCAIHIIVIFGLSDSCIREGQQLCRYNFFLILTLTSLDIFLSFQQQEAKDSRTFGPVSLTDIVGRAIYCLRTAVDHGPVNNRFVVSLLICFIMHQIELSLIVIHSALALSVTLAWRRIHQSWKLNWMLMRWQEVTKRRLCFGYERVS